MTTHARRNLTQARLKEMLSYEPDTGKFTRTVPVSRRPGGQAGDILGKPDKNGYLLIRLDERAWLCHRLAFLYMTGQMPKMVDHINRNPSDNRWVNLREVTPSQNRVNCKRLSTNTTGVTGVGAWGSKIRPYRVIINYQGKRYYLGRFATLEAAAKTRLKAERRIFKEYAPIDRYGVA